MKANELRIGNYIFISVLQGDKFVNELFTVNATVIRDAAHYGNEWNAEPVPLTEEWLLKLGFEKEHDDVDDLWYYRDYFANIQNTYQTFSVNLKSHASCIGLDEELAYFKPEIKYVHQLQNAWFALTGTELEIK